MNVQKLLKRIGSIILCTAMVLTMLAPSGIAFATELTEPEITTTGEEPAQPDAASAEQAEETPIESPDAEPEEFTWRETASERGIYPPGVEEYIGKVWMGETLDEIRQIKQDPECEYSDRVFCAILVHFAVTDLA